MSLIWSYTANAQVIYRNDFESGDEAGWSTVVADPAYQAPIHTEMTPRGGRSFLGRFGNQSVSLALTGLPSHDTLVVSFDLFIIETWDGTFGGDDGPDIWSLNLDGQEVFVTTFSGHSGARQSYPGRYPSGDFSFRAGAEERNTLGFANYGDAVYRMVYAVPHSSPQAALALRAELRDILPTLDNESWGIDNIEVELRSKPAPPPPPLPALLTISLPDLVASIGDTVDVPVRLRDAIRLSERGVTGVRTQVRFNASLLAPIAPTPRGIVEGRERIISFVAPVNTGPDSILTTLRFLVALGDDTVATLTLANTEPQGGEAEVVELPGRVRINGICRQGGPRLIRTSQENLLRALNYRDGVLRIEFATANEGTVATGIEVADLLGRIVVRMSSESFDGADVAIPLDCIASGLYWCRIERGGWASTQPVLVR